ncbi:5-guanidino-2-oxopentanoate decarboxylase [Octadecabacter sp. R77987]|uniref:5-guanidino-2-oxopentanoate decarboxylase n=1 Tax=Octadecabacter sp. R77987 TaxID=3093874 RepID=UPI00366A88DA
MSESPPERPLGAQISHMLKSRGVDVIFGIPGVHNQEMYRGIEEAGITHVLARHEQGAGFMADGYARATGRPGVAYVITGPGLCNTLTPLGQAYSDSVPVLAISSCLGETAATRGQLHQMKDQEGAARTVCDWSETARTADAAYALIDRALMEFQSARPRPKHISVPIPLLQARAAGHDPAPLPTAPLPKASGTQVTDLAAQIRAAKRPLFIFGGGAKGIDFAAPLLARWQAASLTTYAGRGIVPADAPLHFGAYLARGSSADMIGQADLVIALGTELSEVDLWRDKLGHSGTLVRVDIDPQVLSDRHRADVTVLGDCAALLADLGAALPDTGATDWDAGAVAKQRHMWRAEIMTERPGIVPVADALRAALPADTMIYSDMTQFAYAAKEIWPMARAGHWHHPYGFGTLGYALPAAIGGAVARRGLPTVAIAGDYGFQFTLQELGVAVELGLPLPIIVWDNGKLGEIEASMVRAQIAPNAVIQRNPDFIMLARAYGAYTAAPGSLDALQKDVTKALAADGPTLIYVTSDIAGA